ncbi:MAG: thioredoxin family protein [Sedimentisphaerales bacterium]|nr:thioredoxin family protein [Sedimentisphaerales bacterium]
MNKIGKIVIVAALAIVVGMVVVAKQNKSSTTNTTVKNTPCICAPADSSAVSSPESSAESSKEIKEIKEGGQAVGKLPRLLDLGASKCIPCKLMAPILEELKKEYAGTFNVEFIDVWKNPGAGREYGIRMIPTQIFYDASDKEMFRHEGFMSKEDILAKWKDIGVNLGRIQLPSVTPP